MPTMQEIHNTVMIDWYFPSANPLRSPKYDRIEKHRNMTKKKIMMPKDALMNLDPANIRKSPTKI